VTGRSPRPSGPGYALVLGIYSEPLMLDVSGWVRRGFSNNRTRLRGPSLDRFWPPCFRGWGKIPAPAGPAEGGAGGSRDFGPTPGGREAKIGPKMGHRSSVRLLPRPWRTQVSGVFYAVMRTALRQRCLAIHMSIKHSKSFRDRSPHPASDRLECLRWFSKASVEAFANHRRHDDPKQDAENGLGMIWNVCIW
jgi:hypothetical protein